MKTVGINDLCENKSSIQVLIAVHTGFFYGGIPDTLAANMILGLIILALAVIIWSAKHLAFQKTYLQRPYLDFEDVWNWAKGSKMFYLHTYGNQNTQYLLFQRYIIILLLCYCIMDLSTLLPINIFEGENNEPNNFEASIVSNLKISSPFLWIHLVYGWLKLPISVFFMAFYCRKTLKFFVQPMKHSEDTIVMERIPENKRTKAAILTEFKEKYPFAKVSNIYLTYPMKEFLKTQHKIEIIEEVHAQLESNIEPDVPRYRLPSNFNIRSIKKNPAGTKQFYRNKLGKLYRELQKIHNEAMKEPLDIVFIHLESDEDLEEVMSSRVRFDDGILLRKSPPENDIEYKRMIDFRDRIWRKCTNAIILVIIMVFFTTPQTLIALFEDYSGPVSEEVAAWSDSTKALVENIIPSFVRVAIEYMITNIIAWAVGRSGLWSKVESNKKIFQFTTLQLLLILMVLPIAGFKTVEEIVLFCLRSVNQTGRPRGEVGHYNRFKCAFLPMGGASFMELIITDAIIGNMYELFRIADIARLLWKLTKAKSEIEQRIIEKRFKMEFSLAESYSHEMFALTVCVSMSSSTPLILPFGLLYFVIRHCVQSYNLRRKDLESTLVDLSFYKVAISYVIGSTVCLQLFSCIYILIMEYETSSKVTSLGIASICSTVLSILFWFVHSYNGWKFPIKMINF